MPAMEKGLLYVFALVGIFFIKEGYQDIKDNKHITNLQLQQLEVASNTQIKLTEDMINKLDRLAARGEELDNTVRGIESNVLYFAGISMSPTPNKVILGINTSEGNQFEVESEMTNNRSKTRGN